MNHSNFHAPVQQSGVALPVALIMTLLIALLGMTMLRGGIMSELVASNQQQKFVSIEAAQSSIEAIWRHSYLKEEISGTGAMMLDNPPATIQPTTETGVEDQYDLGVVDVGGEVTVQYCGETAAAGTGLDANESAMGIVSALVDVTSRTAIGSTNARALIVQRAAITSVNTGRLGDCVEY